MNYKRSFFSPFCLPSGKAAVLTNSRIHPSPALPRARRRRLLRSSSIRHSPLDALDLGHPQVSLNQGVKAEEIFEQCEKGGNIIFIPSIVVAELLSIFDRKRVSFNFKNLFKKIHTSENFVLIALDYPILEKMVDLKEVPEIHDKIIASTAKYLKVPIITKDKVLQNLSSIRTVW